MVRRATSLGPKPSIFVFVVFLFFVFFGFFMQKEPCFPPDKGIFGLFSVFLFLSPLAFLASLFFCFSLSVSLFSSFLSFFLLVFPFCFLLVSCFCLFFLLVSSLLLFHEKNNIKKINYKVFVHQSFLIFVGFLSSFFFQIPFPYLCFFLILSFVFCSTSMSFFEKMQVQKNIDCWSRGGLQHNAFFTNLCFAKCESYLFLPSFVVFQKAL